MSASDNTLAVYGSLRGEIMEQDTGDSRMSRTASKVYSLGKGQFSLRMTNKCMPMQLFLRDYLFMLAAYDWIGWRKITTIGWSVCE